jgi:hypothetical protein
MDTNKLTWRFDGGQDGVDSDPDNPLSRAVNRLFQTGQPFKRLSMSFYAKTSTTDLSYRRLCWLGVFVLSQADRLIFFPGFNESYKHIKAYQGQSPRREQYFDFDHLTLNADFKYSHITSRNSKTHLGNFPSAKLSGGRFLWFGLSISEFEVLRPVYKETEIVMEVPKSDAKRRAKVFMDSREEAKFQIVENHPDSNGLSAQGFMHISFIAGPSGFETYFGQNHGFPEGSPFLLRPLPEGLVQLPVRRHRISVSQSIDLQMTTAWVPGELKGPLTFTMKR